MLLLFFADTDRPAIITEFGQACCPAHHGACERCSPTYHGTAMGYDEQILTIATAYNVSWLPWGWRPPAANGAGRKCEDLNGGNAFGTALAGPESGDLGADFASLWTRFGRAGGSNPPTPPPAPPAPPGGCPGGSLQACIALCPASPPVAYKDCVQLCGLRCPPM
jgi:hypothetical protein